MSGSIEQGLEVQHPASHRRRVTRGALMLPLFAPPVIWGMQLVVNYLVVTGFCYGDGGSIIVSPAAGGGPWEVLVVTSILTLACMLLLAYLALRSWKATAEEARGSHHELLEVGEGRTRFLAQWGLLMSLAFFVVTLFTSFMLFIVPLCGERAS